jgi:hypothetical protein
VKITQGTAEEYASAQAIRNSVKGLIVKPRSSDLRMKPVAVTVAEGRQKNQGSLSKFEIVPKQLDFGRDEHIGRGPPFRALANEPNGIRLRLARRAWPAPPHRF